ncbi:MAG: hypothetical protein GYB65_23385 [Chloroflexi bacterium]|nr:hypothetical protein [Chloroflexota bacterium]
MSRVVNTNSPGKIRNQLRRTSAEMLRHLSQKAELDDEAKDMAALLFYCLRGIQDGIESSAEVWENRDYWMKAEQLRQRWSWTEGAQARLENVLRTDDWESLPAVIVGLFEHFADIKVTKFTRKPSAWEGAFARFKEEYK